MSRSNPRNRKFSPSPWANDPRRKGQPETSRCVNVLRQNYFLGILVACTSTTTATSSSSSSSHPRPTPGVVTNYTTIIVRTRIIPPFCAYKTGVWNIHTLSYFSPRTYVFVLISSAHELSHFMNDNVPINSRYLKVLDTRSHYRRQPFFCCECTASGQKPVLVPEFGVPDYWYSGRYPT